VILLATDDRVILRTDAGALEGLLPHLQRYGVFDDVSLEDVSGRTLELHLAGPNSDLILDGVAPGTEEYSHIMSRIADVDVRLVRESPTGHSGITIIGRGEDAPVVSRAVHEAGSPLGLVELDAHEFEALRIEAGTPMFGRDVTPDNLPQEVARDSRAINFVKGCYLGQETVARIDALGHVNKTLRGLHFDGNVIPPRGSAVEVDGKAVGMLTSAALAPGSGRVVALGYVRSAYAAAGSRVSIAGSSAIVTDLPMPAEP
jgi:folate-binding protein YgfZ